MFFDYDGATVAKQGYFLNSDLPHQIVKVVIMTLEKVIYIVNSHVYEDQLLLVSLTVLWAGVIDPF